MKLNDNSLAVPMQPTPHGPSSSDDPVIMYINEWFFSTSSIHLRKPMFGVLWIDLDLGLF